MRTQRRTSPPRRRDRLWLRSYPVHEPGWRILASIVKYYVKDNVIAGRLTGADFGLKEGDANFNFAVNDDHVWSRGFIIDLTEPVSFLLRRLQ